MYNSSTIILRAQQQSHATISQTFAIVSAFHEVEGRLLLGSSSRSSHPSLNHINQSDTCVQEGALSPQACLMSWKVSVAVLPILIQNLIFVLCSII
jgi:hypothetical protein